MAISGGEVLYGAYNDALNYDLNKFRAETFAEQVKNNYDLGLKQIDLGQKRVNLEDRRVKQLELLNRMQGASEANANLAMQSKMEALQNTLMQQQTQNEMLKGSLHLKTLNEAITKIAEGDVLSADRLVQNTPTLKESLQKHFGVSKLAPVDFNNPEDIQGLKALGVDVNSLNDKAKEDLKKIVFKSYTPDGKLQLHSLPDLVKELNFDKKATTEQVNTVTSAINTYKKAVSGQTDAPATTNNEFESMATKIAKRASNDPDKQEEIKTNLLEDVANGNITSLEGMVKSVALDDTTRASLMNELKPKDPKQIKAEADAQRAVVMAKEEMNKLQGQEKEKQAKKIFNQHYDELMNSPQIWEGKKLDPALVEVFEKNEKKGATTNDLYKKLKGKLAIYKELKNNLPVIRKALKDKNFVDKAKLVVKEYLKFNDKDKALKEYKGANQKAMNAVLEYVNAISGQSFTDAQIETVKGIVGFDEWKTGNANISGIEKFLESMEGFIKQDIDIIKPDYPASAYRQAVLFNKEKTRKKHFEAGALKKMTDDLFLQRVKKSAEEGAKEAEKNGTPVKLEMAPDNFVE